MVRGQRVIMENRGIDWLVGGEYKWYPTYSITVGLRCGRPTSMCEREH